MSQKITAVRLNKQQMSLEKDPLTNALVTRQGHLNFHFCLYNLEGIYTGGFYHGLLQLHENYPFSAPKLHFYTPTGRFQTNMPICTSFTNYHPQTWTSAWNVRSLILGTISFMYSEEGSYGCRHDNKDVRKKYASESLAFNMKNDKFRSMFQEKLIKIGAIAEKKPDLVMPHLEQEKSLNRQLQKSSSSSGGVDYWNQEEPLINQDQQNKRPKRLKRVLVCVIGLAILGFAGYGISKCI